MASQEILDAVHAIINHVTVIDSAATDLDPLVGDEGRSILLDLRAATAQVVTKATHLRDLVQNPGGGSSLRRGAPPVDPG